VIVKINEAWRNHHPARINYLLACARLELSDLPNLFDLVAFKAHISPPSARTRAINQCSARDQDGGRLLVCRL
jgi:hypothetical protein